MENTEKNQKKYSSILKIYKNSNCERLYDVIVSKNTLYNSSYKIENIETKMLLNKNHVFIKNLK